MTLVPPNANRGGYPLGLAGATAATRYVGATASGAPASGTFAVGDFVIDRSGGLYVCTAAGSPGTWSAIGGAAAAFRGCRANRTANQVVATATFTPIQLDAADTYDTDAFHDPATNNTRLTVPAGLGGYYLVVGELLFETNGTGSRVATIRANGATYLAETQMASSGAGIQTAVQVTTVALLAATEYVELEAYQTSGANRNTTGHFICARLGA